MAATANYAKALVAHHAKELMEAIHAVQTHETDTITLHKLSEVCAECAWCERTYGEAER